MYLKWGEDIKLKVGIFNESFPPTIDGVSNCAFNYAKVLSENYADCTVVTPKYPHVTDDYPFEVYRYSSADISKHIGYRVGNMFSPSMLRYLNSKHFDIIHAHSPFASLMITAELKKMRADIPVVFTYHTKFDIEFQKRLRVRPLCKFAERLACHNISLANEVWVVSEGAVQSLRNIGYKGAYRVMKNGTDFKRGLADENEIDILRKSLDIADDEYMFLFVGRMMWYKNVGLIIDSLARLPQSVKYKMVFVGDGDDRPAVEHYAKTLGIYDKMRFSGAVYDREKVRVYFSAADLFLFPSTYDTAGLVVMEAAACNLPSVLIGGSCAAEGVKDGFSGFLCEENAESMADKIMYALSDADRRRKIGENAGEYVYLSWEDAVKAAYKRYCEIYKEFHEQKHKKSVIERAMPSNIKKSAVNAVKRSENAAARGISRVKNAGKTAADTAKNTAGKIAVGIKSTANNMTSGIKGVIKEDAARNSDKTK